MHYHIILKSKRDKYYGEFKSNISEDQLKGRYLDPYEKGETLVINGKFIEIEDLERISVYKSESPIEYYINVLKAEDSRSTTVFFGLAPYEYRAITKTQDITDEYIRGKPGFKKLNIDKDNKKLYKNKNRVFIVHGHAEAAKVNAARLVERLGFEAIILHEQVSAGRTIIEKIEGFTDVGFGIVLYTPDDVGNNKESSADLNKRARQNVIFEHGYLIGKLNRENVVALVSDNIELPNDISGVVYIKMDEEGAWKYKVAKEMQHSGFDVNMNLIN